MFSPEQSSSRWQLCGAGAAGASGLGAGAVAGSAPGSFAAAATLRNGSRCSVGPGEWPNGSSAPARAVPATQTRTTSDATKTRGRRFTKSGRSLLRGEHLPFAVLENEGDLAGIALVALLAKDLQGGGLPLDLRFLDLELRPFELFLHLLDAFLRLTEAHLRGQHPLVHERVAVDRLFAGALDQRLAPALERLLRRRELRARRRKLEGDRADLLLRQLHRLAVGLDGVNAVVEVDDLGVQLGLVDELDGLRARGGSQHDGRQKARPQHDGSYHRESFVVSHV